MCPLHNRFTLTQVRPTELVISEFRMGSRWTHLEYSFQSEETIRSLGKSDSVCGMCVKYGDVWNCLVNIYN
jgi:hypothetical protein